MAGLAQSKSSKEYVKNTLLCAVINILFKYGFPPPKKKHDEAMVCIKRARSRENGRDAVIRLSFSQTRISNLQTYQNGRYSKHLLLFIFSCML